MRRTATGAGFCALLFIGLMPAMAASGTGRQPAWWKQGKINFMWGVWPLCSSVPTDDPVWARYERPVPRETFRNVAQAGGTVFCDLWKYSAEHARFAHEFGLKYFASVHLGHMKPDGRNWIDKHGVEVEKPEAKPNMHVCPLDESEYEKWLVPAPLLDGIRKGLVDGISVDWESTEGGVCYCDYCFGQFLAIRNITVAALPEKPQRFDFITARHLEAAYEQNFHRQRVEMFTRIRKKLRRLNPDLLFTGYSVLFSDFTRAMHTPEAPYIVLDGRHYYNDDRQPWWESYSQRIKDEGYLYIAGGWSNALFGAQASQVSAARWIYEAMINEDGVWLWWDHRMPDEVYTAYATAERRVRAVEGAVGEFLLNGRRDPTFVTVVEWTGNPELEKAAVSRTYHLGRRHLVHVNNVNADWPLRVRLRFPRLGPGRWLEPGRWTVRDPLGGACYSMDGKSASWSTAQLESGVVVTLDARSDLFVLLARTRRDPAKAGARLVWSREFDALYDHQLAAERADPVRAVAAGEGVAIYETDLERLLDSAENLAELPAGGWSFRMDPQNVGGSEKWFTAEAAPEGWTPIAVGDFWGDQGGIGVGWYRRFVEIPQLPDNKRIYLHFGAVDEDLKLWIDGEYVGECSRGALGWDQPFAMEVTGKLLPGRRHLALRVYNRADAGGVWKPVTVCASAADVQSGPGDSGPLLFTAAEQMMTMIGEWGTGHRSFVNNGICTVAAADGDRQKLRHLYGQLWSPSYSPDGSRIVFTHDAGGRGQIWVMNANGGEAQNLSGNGFCDRAPAWSPDGRRIAFISDRGADWDIYVMNADGGGQRKLAGNPGLDRAPDWSPDGTRLAWESHLSGMPGIWVVNADGTDSRSLIAPDKPFTVRKASKGTDLVFVIDEVAAKKWMFDDNAVYLTDPVWSPDGSRIAARGLRPDSGVTASVLDADGSSMLLGISPVSGLDNLVWSPDGTKLAGSFRTAPQETDRSGIVVFNADGTNDKPHGDFIVDVTPRGPRLTKALRPGIPTWYSQGSAEPRRVLKTFTSLRWSPDGTTLAFSSDLDVSGAFYVYTVPAAGGPPVMLKATQSAWPNDIDWKPR